MNNIQKALERIDVKNYDNCSYNDWIELLYTCKAAGVSFSDFDGWAQGGSKYDAESIKASWYSASPTESEETARKRLFYKAKLFLPQISEGKTIDSIPAYDKDLALDNAKKFLNYIDNGKNWVLAPEFLDENGKKTFVDEANCCNSAKEFSDNLDKLEFDFFSKAVGFCFTSNSCDKSWKKGSATDFRYCILESDEISLSEQYRLALSKKLPVFAGIFSGGKSIHLWCRVDAKDRMEWEERVDFLKDFLRKNNINFDESVLNNPEHLTRFPLGKRVVFDKTTGARTECNQYVVYFDESSKSFKEWKKELEAKIHLVCPFVFDQKKNKFIYSFDNTIKLAIQKGFYKFETEDGFGFCQRNDYMLKEVSEEKIISSLADTVRKNFPQNFSDFGEKADSLTRKKLLFLPETTPSVHRDSSDTVFLYFKNGVLEIKKDSKKLIPFDDMPENFLIWKDEIIKRDFKDAESDGEFAEFVRLVTSDIEEDSTRDSAMTNEKRFQAVRTALGYLLSRYKDPSRAKAICFIDRAENGGNNGGSGKSILADSVGEKGGLRISGKSDSKRLDKNSFRFAFAGIKKSQCSYHIEDVKKDFSFELFYNMITTDVEIERKGVDVKKIPFELAPKFVLSSNQIVRGCLDHSTRRRIELYEVANYFDSSYTPFDHFRHVLFNDWDEAEWNKFDAFMIECIQLFLKSGLESYTDEKIEKRIIISSVGVEMEEFIQYWMKGKKLDGTEHFRSDTIFADYKDHVGFKAIYKSTKSFMNVFKNFFQGGIEKGHDKFGNFWTIKKDKCKVFAEEFKKIDEDEDEDEKQAIPDVSKFIKGGRLAAI